MVFSITEGEKKVLQDRRAWSYGFASNVALFLPMVVFIFLARSGAYSSDSVVQNGLWWMSVSYLFFLPLAIVMLLRSLQAWHYLYITQQVNRVYCWGGKLFAIAPNIAALYLFIYFR